MQAEFNQMPRVNLEAVLVSDLICEAGKVKSFFLSKKLETGIDKAYKLEGDLTRDAYKKLNTFLLMLVSQRDSLSEREFAEGLNRIITYYENAKIAARPRAEHGFNR